MGSVLGTPRELGNPCHNRGEEERHLHDPRPLQDQDPCEASHQGRNEDGLWPGDQGEGIPSCCTQVTDLSGGSVASFLWAAQRLGCRGNPTDQVWVAHLPCRE